PQNYGIATSGNGVGLAHFCRAGAALVRGADFPPCLWPTSIANAVANAKVTEPGLRFPVVCKYDGLLRQQRMSRYGPIDLPPMRGDIAIARVCAHAATPARQRALKLVTLLADERALLAVGAAVWIGTRCGRAGPERREADRMLG